MAQQAKIPIRDSRMQSPVVLKDYQQDRSRLLCSPANGQLSTRWGQSQKLREEACGQTSIPSQVASAILEHMPMRLLHLRKYSLCWAVGSCRLGCLLHSCQNPTLQVSLPSCALFELSPAITKQQSSASFVKLRRDRVYTAVQSHSSKTAAVQNSEPLVHQDQNLCCPMSRCFERQPS